MDHMASDIAGAAGDQNRHAMDPLNRCAFLVLNLGKKHR
jgi:hypothetical protein